VNQFLKEILEQPQALRDTLQFYEQNEGKEKLRKMRDLHDANKIGSVIFTGMGSSYFASYFAACLFHDCGMNSQAMNTSELLRYHLSILDKNKLLVCVSQSGESFEIVRLLETIPREVPCWGVSNEGNGSLARLASFSLLSKAGPEEMTSTKTFVSTLLVMAIMGWSLAGIWGREKIAMLDKAIDELETLLTVSNPWLNSAIDFLGDFHFLQIIGRGPSYATARQSALMFKEAARTPAEGILGGEFRHGPMEMVTEGFQAVVFAPRGNTFHQSLKMAHDIATCGGRVVLITNASKEQGNKNIHVLRIPETDECLFPLLGIVPLQLIVNQFALRRGIQPGHFVRGAKVTTVE